MLLRIDIDGTDPRTGHLALLDIALGRLAPGADVTLMLHGFRYAPGNPHHDPHDHILGPLGGPGRSLSWPRHMGFRDPAATAGLGIALGWQARGTIWAAHRASGLAAEGLARIVARVRALRPDLRIGAMGHSLGARVILAALPRLAAGALGRAVLLSAAAFRAESVAALDSPAGRTVEIVNVTSRENDLFDTLTELLLPGGFTWSVGNGLGAAQANWVDVQLDHPQVMRALARIGFPVAPPARRICHWSAYRRPGVFALYRALLTDPARLPLAALADVLPERQSRRWSRLLAPPRPRLPLPFPRGASS